MERTERSEQRGEHGDSAQVASLLREMERELQEYPESAGEIMVDTVGELHRRGCLEAALELSRRMITELSGEDAGYGHFQQIDALFALGRDDEAEAALAAMWALDTDDLAAAYLVSELLDERGDTTRALRWVDRSLATALSVVDDDPESVIGTADLMAAEWRAGLRGRLGFAPDALDRLAASHGHAAILRKALGGPDAYDEGLAALGMAEPPPAADGTEEPAVPVLSHIVRADVAAAHTEGILAGYDGEGEEELTPDRYFREVELNRREMRRETSFSKGRDVPISLAEIRAYAEAEGISALTPDVRLRAASAKYADGRGDFPMWPPERNASCWCASGRKYKKCCGRP